MLHRGAYQEHKGLFGTYTGLLTHRQYKGVERPRNDFRGFTVGKSVQIPESLFFDLVRWFWAEQQTADREQRIKDELAKKVTAMSKRQQYMDFLFANKDDSVTES